MAASLFERAYHTLIRYAGCLQSAVLLVVRLAWGWEAAQSGWAHLHNVEKTAAFFRDLHIPFPVLNVYISGSTELVGGTLLMLGLATRLISIPFAFNFLIAIITAGGAEIVGKFKTGIPAGWTRIVDDTAFPFLTLGLVMLAFGPGKASIDYLLRRMVFRRPSPRE